MGEKLQALKDSIAEQEWFLQIKGKWEELDPRSRLYLQGAGVAIGLLAVGIVVINILWSVHRLRTEATEKSELLTQIQSASDELKKLKEISSGLSTAPNPQPWPEYFQATATSVGVQPDGIAVSEPKTGTSNDISKEALFDVSLKHANIKQVVKFAQGLESGARPVKLRDLVIDTDPDGSGYMDATLSVSAFSLVQAKQ